MAATSPPGLGFRQGEIGGTGYCNNVIIETLWCGFDTANQGGEVVNKIAAAVSQA